MRHHHKTSQPRSRPELLSRDRTGHQEEREAEAGHSSNRRVHPSAEVPRHLNREQRRTSSEARRRSRHRRHNRRNRHRRRRWSSRHWSWWRRGYHVSDSHRGEDDNRSERRDHDYIESREERSARRRRSHRRRRRHRRRSRSRSRRHWRRRSWSRPRATRSRINALKGAGDAGPRFFHIDDDVS